MRGKRSVWYGGYKWAVEGYSPSPMGIHCDGPLPLNLKGSMALFFKLISDLSLMDMRRCKKKNSDIFM